MGESPIDEPARTNGPELNLDPGIWRVLKPILRKHWLTEAMFRDCVERVEQHATAYSRALHTFERREVVLETEPRKGVRANQLSPIPDPAGIDPWTVDADRLRQDTERFSDCPGCRGEKRAVCASCEGSGRAKCTNCNGGGKVAGQRGRRNCPVCRGRGDTSCPNCSRGMVACGTCTGIGRVVARLGVRSSIWFQGKVDTPAFAESVHPDAADPSDFATPSDQLPTDLVVDRVVESEAALADLPPQLQPTGDAKLDRVARTRLQRLEYRYQDIHYRTRFGRAMIRATTRSPQLEPESDWKPLATRKSLVIIALIISGLWVMFTVGSYSGQHEWYAKYGSGGSLFLLALVAAISGSLAAAGLLLAKRAQTLFRTWFPLGMTALALVGVVLVFRLGNPKMARAEFALQSGDLTRAQLEAAAASKAHQAGADSLLDRVHLAALSTSSELKQVAEHARGQWYTPAGRQAARELALSVATASAERFRGAADGQGLASVAAEVAELDPELAARLNAEASVFEAEACLGKANFDCAASHLDAARGAGVAAADVQRVADSLETAMRQHIEALDAEARTKQDTPSRLATLTSLSAALGKFSQITGKTASVDQASVTRQIEHAEAALKLEQAAEQRRLEREAAAEQRRQEQLAAAERRRQEQQAAAERQKERQAAAAERRKEQQAAAAQRAGRRRTSVSRPAAPARSRASSGRLLCCDGTLSPSCMCSGSHRGCCSHHGGVCGCD